MNEDRTVSYLTVNVHCSLGQGKNNPEGDLGIIGLPPWFKKERPSPHFK